jgi:SAM-dependent methyltransferase
MPRAQAASDTRDNLQHSRFARDAEVGGFFDSFADTYDRVYDSPGGAGRALRRRLETVLELLGPGPGDVLDAGMGGGVVCEALEQRGWTAAGVDISPRMVELARARLPQGAERLVEGSILALPYEDDSFDAVVVTGVLEYVERSLPIAMSEVARVLRPGGVAVVSLPNYGSLQVGFSYRLYFPAVRAVKGALGWSLPPSRRIVALRELLDALAAAGLAVERIELVAARMIPAAMGDRMERSRSGLLPRLGTQFVLRAGKSPS